MPDDEKTQSGDDMLRDVHEWLAGLGEEQVEETLAEESAQDHPAPEWPAAEQVESGVPDRAARRLEKALTDARRVAEQKGYVLRVTLRYPTAVFFVVHPADRLDVGKEFGLRLRPSGDVDVVGDEGPGSGRGAKFFLARERFLQRHHDLIEVFRREGHDPELQAKRVVSGGTGGSQVVQRLWLTCRWCGRTYRQWLPKFVQPLRPGRPCPGGG